MSTFDWHKYYFDRFKYTTWLDFQSKLKRFLFDLIVFVKLKKKRKICLLPGIKYRRRKFWSYFLSGVDKNASIFPKNVIFSRIKASHIMTCERRTVRQDKKQFLWSNFTRFKNISFFTFFRSLFAGLRTLHTEKYVVA